MRLFGCLSGWLLLRTIAAIPQELVVDEEPSSDTQEQNVQSYSDASFGTIRSSGNSYVDEIRVFSRRTTEIKTASSATCATSCTVHAPRISVVSWVPKDTIFYTSNVTIGIITTLIFLCNDIVVATRTQTEYHWDAAPADMYPPYSTTNHHGNAVAVAAFTDAAITSVVELVYPNSHTAYGSQFSWEGVIDVSLYDGNPGICATATPELSTTHLESHRPFPRKDYLQPTATAANGSDMSGRGYQPLWVPLDSQPSESFFTHLRNEFYSLMQSIHTYGAWLECEFAASVHPTPSLFREARYVYDHKTMSIDLDVSGMSTSKIVSGTWRNDTGSGAICTDFAQKFIGLCERPEIPATIDQCVLTAWNYSNSNTWSNERSTAAAIIFEQTQTGWDYMHTEDDRSGFFMRSTSGFETVNNIQASTTAIIYATNDWTTDGAGGIVTALSPQSTQEYLNSGTEDRVSSWSRPQRTQPPLSPEKGLEPIESQAIQDYFKTHPEYVAQSKTDTEYADTTEVVPGLFDANTAFRLDALGSALNKIFFYGTTANNAHTRKSSLEIDAIESKPTRSTAGSNSVPAVAVGAGGDIGTVVNAMLQESSTTPHELPYARIPTMIDDIPTAVGGYILPVTSTLIADQRIVIEGQATQLSVPDLLPMFLSMTVNGVPTSTVGYIVSGRSSATIGQTITLNGEPTVLVTPDALFVQFPTTDSNGRVSTTPAYIISGTSTASIGQEVTLNGTPTVLAALDMVPTFITAMVSGAEETSLAYIVTGLSTATIGQTVTVGGSTTVLAEPSSQSSVAEGRAGRTGEPCCDAVLIGIGAVLVVGL